MDGKDMAAMLEEAGVEPTAVRLAVGQVLAGGERALPAGDILRKVREAMPVNKVTLYRILDLFVRTNLANRLESANAYLANVHPGCRHDCIFLICDKCGQATHVDDDGLTGALRNAGQRAGFADVRPVVELRGLCNACAG